MWPVKTFPIFHLQINILIIYEILAVGDPPFQEKLWKKMQSLTQEERTIIFVSHQMEKVRFFVLKFSGFKMAIS